jgi:DNA-binding transcriptional regulator WhiA
MEKADLILLSEKDKAKGIVFPQQMSSELAVPLAVRKNNLYLQSFVRGLVYTDGCTVIQKQGKYAYALIKISTCIRKFAYDLKDCLKKLKIESYVCKKNPGFDVVVRKKHSFERFFTLIQPKNRKGGDGGI